jgi:hypothetical protein
LLVALPKVENVASISLLNQGAQGNLSIAAANAKLPANSPQWQTLMQRELSGDGLHANIGPSEAKYVRLTFNLTAPGRIAALGIYSSPRVSDFTSPRASQTTTQEKSDSFTLVSNKLNDVHGKARALYVSSGANATEANNMIDDQTSTVYTFAAEDGSPTTIIDLGRNSSLRRAAAVYSAGAGSMQFYVLQTLPGGQSASDSLRLDDAVLANFKPVGVVNDDGTRGRAAVDFPAVVGRYLMVRWIPAANQEQAFSVSELAAFGKATDDKKLLAANNGLTFAQVNAANSDGKTMMDGKTLIEPKDVREGPQEEAPQSPAEGPPPSLPQPPPFTFVPVMVPTSP